MIQAFIKECNFYLYASLGELSLFEDPLIYGARLVTGIGAVGTVRLCLEYGLLSVVCRIEKFEKPTTRITKLPASSLTAQGNKFGAHSFEGTRDWLERSHRNLPAVGIFKFSVLTIISQPHICLLPNVSQNGCFHQEEYSQTDHPAI
ncbi:hypothetical protein PM082_018592 [Marasmius tenuissimus]|nr:hypothetical protein PM082_018592 [Marasmius tenuissimus]